MKDALERVTAAERSRERARRHRHAPWRDALRVGSLGWLIALPVAGGALLGHWLDRRWGTGIRWSVGFLLLGLVIAGYTLWRHAAAVQPDREEP